MAVEDVGLVGLVNILHEHEHIGLVDLFGQSINQIAIDATSRHDS